jgi:hypothetical protein
MSDKSGWVSKDFTFISVPSSSLFAMDVGFGSRFGGSASVLFAGNLF